MAKSNRLANKTQNRRGCPEAIEKRRVARLFNDILGGRGAGAHRAYAFRPEGYRFVGAAHDVLRSAGVLTSESPSRGRARRRAA
jgi:hypothetical protein